MFAGREEQVRLVVDAVSQKGQHAIIFGERGVGKTSLANVLSSFLSDPSGVLAPRVNCDGLDSFETVWRNVFEQIDLTRESPAMGFGDNRRLEEGDATALLPDVVNPDGVRRAVTVLSREALAIIIIDEFDRLSQEVKRSIADTIKGLSDHAVAATVVLVGVADSVNELIHEHESVERALEQIRMPRMSVEEINEIVNTGLARLGMETTDIARRRVAVLAQGLPHYAHLLALHAARSAIDRESDEIAADDVDFAITKALETTQQSIRTAYHDAIRSPRRDNLFGDVLLACALAEKDELGYFAAQDVRGPIQTITGKNYDIPSFAKHLNEFCEDKRGCILHRLGTPRRYRFRFSNPLMQPFVLMQGFSAKKISASVLDTLSVGI